MLIFATVAALTLAVEWNMDYAALIPYATPGFVAFGLCAIPAGWLADKWSREGMMVIFFIGIGASGVLTALVQTPLQIALGLTLIGVFAAIYHPVGIALVVQGRKSTGVPLAINGIFGNMGVACAALLTGWFIDNAGWRAAFIVPGIVSVAIGLGYWAFIRGWRDDTSGQIDKRPSGKNPTHIDRRILIRVFSIIFFTTAVGGLTFQSTTFSLPKVFDERLQDLAGTATMIGWYAFLVFSVAAFAQLVVGWLVDRYSVRTVFAWVAFIQIVSFAFMVQLDGTAALVVAIAFMLVVFGQIPINDVLVGRITRSEWRRRVYAFRYIITFTVSSTAVPLIAWIHANWGFDVLFGVLAVAATFIFTAALMLPKQGAYIGGG